MLTCLVLLAFGRNVDIERGLEGMITDRDNNLGIQRRIQY